MTKKKSNSKSSSKRKFLGLSRKAWFYNILILLFAIFIMYWAAPAWLSGVLYKGFITKIPFVGIIIITLWFGWSAFKQYRNNNNTRSAILGIFGLAIGVIGFITANKWTNNITYDIFADEVVKLDKYLPVDKNTLRFNPRKMAFNKIETGVRARTEEVDFEHIFPYISNDGFGYIAPILLDGLRPSFMERNPGFFVYHDNPKVETVIERVDQEFEIGVEMYYTDNIYRQLYFEDFFAVYDDIHYFPLDVDNPKKFTGVAPKIKYKYSFPFFFAKYWAGVTLIESDGTITELSVEEAQKDERLNKRWIYPMSLAKHYVEIQDYAVGYLNSFTSVDGMLSIPELEHNEYPFVIYGEDGQTYFVIDTEPKGAGRGMYRMYYINASNGQISYYEPPANQPAIGPRGALSKVYSIKGYNWLRKTKDGQSGNTIAIEPVYLTKTVEDEVNLYYKFSVTSVDMTEVSATVVVEAREGGELKEFTDRQSYENWKDDANINEVTIEGVPEIDTSLSSDKISQLEQYLKAISSMTNKANLLIKELKSEKADTILIK